MAIYRSVNGVARQVTEQCRGIGGVARQVTTEYRGVDNVARLVFGNRTYLYASGDLCADITGGWNQKTGNRVFSSDRTGWSGVPTMTQESDHFYSYIPDQTGYSGGVLNMAGSWYTTNRINLSEYTKLKFEVEVTWGDGIEPKDVDGSSAFLQIATSTSTYSDDNVSSKSYGWGSITSLNGKRVVGEVDISSETRSLYIIARIVRSLERVSNDKDDSMSAKIYNIWLE